MEKKVVVAMSGGVDSAVAAYLLKEKGYSVIGVTFHIWDRYSIKENEKICCGYYGIRDAQSCAENLKIPHYLLDLRKLFNEIIIKDFINNYLSGFTPNPCAECNRYIKFLALLDFANKVSADYIATGHYAQIIKINNNYFLKRAKSKKDDQTYFLYSLTDEILARTIFPLGEKSKKEVREIALKLSLPVAKKKKSQEICFIPDKKYSDFILKILEEKGKDKLNKEGPIYLIENGKITFLGTHKGIYQYTIGQRRGLRIPYKERLYVLKIDSKNNALYVGKKDLVYKRRFLLKKEIWKEKEIENKNFLCQIRNVHQPSEIRVKKINEDLFLCEFLTSQWAITPGQKAVFYDLENEIVLGGGTILKVLDNESDYSKTSN